MTKKDIREDLDRFNQILGYSPEKGGMLSERKVRRAYLAEDEPEEGQPEEGGEENADFDFGDEGSPEEGGEENADFDFGDEEMDFGGEEGGEEETDEFGTADEFSAADELEDIESDVEEIDVTAIVDKSEEAKEAAQQAFSASQENSEYIKTVTDRIENLTAQLSKMDSILGKVTELERQIKTPEEKLELRSLDSYPFNLKLTDYWEEKSQQNDNYKVTNGNKEKEYTISKEDVDEYNEEEIANSFNPEGDDVTIWKRKKQY